MFRYLRSLKTVAVVGVGFGLVMGMEITQTFAEGFLTDAESQMTTMVNQHRTSIGQTALQTNDSLRVVARRQTQRMAMAGYIYHNPDFAKEADDAIPGWSLIGENVGVGPSTEAVEEAFLNSPNHRKNIETARFNVIGLGAVATEDGAMYFTQNFADWRPRQPAPATTAPQPKTAAPKTAAPRPSTKVAAAKAAAPAPVTAPPTQAPATPATTVAPTQQPGPLADRVDDVTLWAGLLGMLERVFSKLAFWA